MKTLMFCSNQMQMFPTDTSHLASADKVTLRKQLDRMRMDSDDGDLHKSSLISVMGMKKFLLNMTLIIRDGSRYQIG